jgi:hypothetical protein
MGQCSLGEDIFLGSSTKEYITVILLGTEEFKKTEEHMLFSVVNEANFIDWYRNLRIVLRQEKTKFATQPYPEDHPVGSSVVGHRAYETRCDDALSMSYLMLATMVPNLQKQYEHVDAYTMI